MKRLVFIISLLVVVGLVCPYSSAQEEVYNKEGAGLAESIEIENLEHEIFSLKEKLKIEKDPQKKKILVDELKNKTKLLEEAKERKAAEGGVSGAAQGGAVGGLFATATIFEPVGNVTPGKGASLPIDKTVTLRSLLAGPGPEVAGGPFNIKLKEAEPGSIPGVDFNV